MRNDWYHRRIPNHFLLVLLLMWIPIFIFKPSNLAYIGISFIFILSIIAYLKNMFGGGDIKYLMVSSLFISKNVIFHWLFVVTLMGLLLCFVLAHKKQIQKGIPYGVNIGMTNILYLLLSGAHYV